MARILSLVRSLVFLAVVLAPLASAELAEAATITVNTIDDTSDGVCNASHCSLREAITAANASAFPDSITFDIPGTGPHVIQLTSSLTILQPSTVISGGTSPAYPHAPTIVLDGSLTGGDGLVILGDYTVVRHLSVINFAGASARAIRASANSITIEACYVGLDPAGAVRGNTIGIDVGGSETTLRNNLIGGNGTGIRIDSSYEITVSGNLIGVDPTGMEARSNGTGIRVQGNSLDVVIGGPNREDRNIISGSTEYGIDDSSRVTNLIIQNNAIGIAVATARPVPNAIGIARRCEGPCGGAQHILSSVISGNGDGLHLRGGAEVEGNLIGLDSAGGTAIPNTGTGILLNACMYCSLVDNTISGNGIGVVLSTSEGPSDETLVSGNRFGLNLVEAAMIPNGVGLIVEGARETVIEGNKFAGGEIGIQLNSGEGVIRRNYIGTPDGERSMPCGTGIRVGGGFSPSTIGGSSEADGNVIAFNTGDGIRSLAGSQVIWNNQIFSNGGHGVHIDAGMAERSPAGLGNVISLNRIYDNDGLGIRVAAPELVGGLEPPELRSVTTTSVTGTAAPNALVEVFLAAPDPTYYGEGRTYLTQHSAGADGSFTVTFPNTGSCPIYTATATDGHGNTSEFSRNRSTCARLPRLAGIGILIGMAAGGSAFTLVVRRRPPDLRGLPWIAFGGLVGLGLGLLLLRLPFVQLTGGGEQQISTPVPGGGNLPAPVTLTPVTITLTPALAPEIMARENANCRQGPSTQFNVATHLLQGQVVPITGRLADGGWWLVQPPNLEAPCWIAESLVEPNGDLTAVPAVIPPAPPTVTPAEEPSRAQGCWVYVANLDLNVCTVPCPANPNPGGACTP